MSNDIASETYTGSLPDGTLGFRLAHVRLADLPPGALLSRRPPHQLLDELAGADPESIIMGLALRGPHALDPVLAESLVWELTFTHPPASAGEAPHA
jgi:hypothetical protein